MNSILSERARQIKPSATVAANDKAKKLKAAGKDIINLTAGQPDFNTPEFAKQAGIDLDTILPLKKTLRDLADNFNIQTETNA